MPGSRSLSRSLLARHRRAERRTQKYRAAKPPPTRLGCMAVPQSQWPDIPIVPYEWDRGHAYQYEANILISEGFCPKHICSLSWDGRCVACGGVTWELTSNAGTASSTGPFPPWAVTDGRTVL